MKQIILITDGCSNVGVSPVVAAAHAHAEGMLVNVVGVIDQGELGERGAEEIREIADAGGGMSRIVASSQLAQTVQMMTRKTVAYTIQAEVDKQMKSLFGHSGLDQLPPGQRAQVVQTIDELAETSSLDVVLLIDASASMKPKMDSVREAVRDLMLSLQARMGKSRLAVFHFPGSANADEEVVMDSEWTSNLANVDKMFYKLNMKGTTPTGPALMKVIRYMAGEPLAGREKRAQTAAQKQGRDAG